MEHSILEDKRQKVKDVTFRAFAAIGLVVVLGVLSWVGVRTIQNAPDAFSTIAGAFVNLQSRFIPNEQIVLSADTDDIVSEEQFMLSWEHRGKDNDGSYSLFYPCRDGLHFERTNPEGETAIVFCNTPLQILDTDTNILLTPVSTKSRNIEVPLLIQFVRNGTNRIDQSGELLVDVFSPLIQNDDTTPDATGNVTPVGNGGGTTQTPGQETDETRLFASTTNSVSSDPNGRPDLKATVIATGVVSRTTNEFTATSSIRSIDRAGVTFEVVNLGTKESGTWYFNSVLPTNPSHIFTSKVQQSLFPGDRIEFMLGFDSIRDIGANEVVINIDPSSSIRNEVTRNNNIVRTTIIVLPN